MKKILPFALFCSIVILAFLYVERNLFNNTEVHAQSASNTISGHVFHDKNDNGKPDSGEEALNKLGSSSFPMIIELIKDSPSTGTVKASETSPDTNGNYQFTNLDFDTYRYSIIIHYTNTTPGAPGYFPTTSTTISNMKAARTIDFGFGSDEVAGNIPIDTCSSTFIPPTPGGPEFMTVVTRMNPDLSVTGGKYYELSTSGTNEKYGSLVLSGQSLVRLYPWIEPKQYVIVNKIEASRFLSDPGTPNSTPELNVKRNGRVNCSLVLKDPGKIYWTHTASADFNAKETLGGVILWNDAVAPIISSCTVSLSASPSTIAANQSSTLSWTSTNVLGNCSASGRWGGGVAENGSQSTGPLTNTANYSITCHNENQETCTASTTVTVGSTVDCSKQAKGDTNCDGRIDLLDFNIWRDNFLAQ